MLLRQKTHYVSIVLSIPLKSKETMIYWLRKQITSVFLYWGINLKRTICLEFFIELISQPATCHNVKNTSAFLINLILNYVNY